MANLVATLMDEAHSFTTKRKWREITWSHEVMAILQQQRIKLREAERFVLDDEAVRLVCHLSKEDKDRLQSWSSLARLPYNTMWVEFDLHVKVREFERMGTLAHTPFNPNETANRIGYLLFRDEGNDSENFRWVCHEFTHFNAGVMSTDTALEGVGVPYGDGHQHDMGGIWPGHIAFVFDPDGTGQNPVRGSKYWQAPTLSLIPNFPKVPTMKEREGERAPAERWMLDPEEMLCGYFEFKAEEKVHTISVPEWYASRAAVILEPIWTKTFERWYTGSDEALKAKSVRRHHNIALRQCMEQAGVLRWVITMLGAINELPRALKTIQGRPASFAHGKPKPAMLGHHHLTITLPRDNRIVYAREALNKAWRHHRNRWHKVIGHWRIVEKGKVLETRCRHMPVMVEGTLAMCERCSMLIRWIPEHSRGDASLGIVDHTYEVTTGHGRRSKRE